MIYVYISKPQVKNKYFITKFMALSILKIFSTLSFNKKKYYFKIFKYLREIQIFDKYEIPRRVFE